ncbi:MAG: hypothetical protein ABFD54_14235 [Armatimonadota bacterium]|nr:hypothetical protein [bacterium]
METVEKPAKMKLSTAAWDYFSRNANATVVCLRTKEGREFWFRRDPRTGEPIKISREIAEKL